MGAYGLGSRLSVYHSTTRIGVAENILNGINPAFFNPASRFGRGFYVGGSPSTTLAELAYHGATRANTIQYSLLNRGFLNATGPLANIGVKYTPKLMSRISQKLGYEGILFQSLRSQGGINFVLFNNFGKLQNGTIIF